RRPPRGEPREPRHPTDADPRGRFRRERVRKRRCRGSSPGRDREKSWSMPRRSWHPRYFSESEKDLTTETQRHREVKRQQIKGNNSLLSAHSRFVFSVPLCLCG